MIIIEKENNNYISSLSILGAIILLIGLFSPGAISYGTDPTYYILINNLLALYLYGMHHRGVIEQNVIPAFPRHPLGFVSGIFLVFVMAACCTSIFLTSLKFRRGGMDFQRYRMVSLNNAFILIADSFLWLLLITMDFDHYGENFWRLFYISFGIIAPFITATLIFIEFLINRSKLKQKTYRYYLPFTSMGGFLVLIVALSIAYSRMMDVTLVLLVLYLLFVALFIFIGVFTAYSSPKKGYYILIVALIMSGFMLLLLSTIIPIGKELKKSKT